MAEERDGPLASLNIHVSSVDQGIEHAPVLQVDGALGLVTTDDLVRFNFYQDLLAISPPKEAGGFPTEPQIVRRVAARIVMSKKVFVEFHNWLSQGGTALRKEIERSGGGRGGPAS